MPSTLKVSPDRTRPALMHLGLAHATSFWLLFGTLPALSVAFLNPECYAGSRNNADFKKLLADLQPKTPPAKPAAPAVPTQEQLAAAVRKAIDKKTVALVEPEIKDVGGRLGYLTLGGIQRAEGELQPDDDDQTHWYPAKPLDVPADLQFRIEALRKYMATDKHKTFTEKNLKQLTQIVSEELALIAKQGSAKDLLKKLGPLDRKAVQVLVAAIKTRAKREKLDYAGQLFGGAALFSVALTNVPAKAAVGYLRLFEYGFAKQPEKLSSWWTVDKEVELPFGDYMFRVFLSDGKTVTKKVHVDKNLSVSFAGPAQ